MTNTPIESSASHGGVVRGQRFAYATAALLTALLSYVHLLGLEKALLAIAFATLALRSGPPPRLERRRSWARFGLVLAIGYVILLGIGLVLFWDRFEALILALDGLV